MTLTQQRCAAIAFAALGLVPLTALAGPCDDDIAVLKRRLGNQVGLGAPVSEPARGQTEATASVGGPASEARGVDRSQAGGASRTAGGSTGTVGGVAGAPTSAAGSGTGNGIATGAIATSPEDVRRQSEGRPTAAAQAARGGAAPQAADTDRISQAKTALQRAVDLNAAGDQACAGAITEAKRLAPQ